MKRLLLFFSALLVVASGAWAASPAAGAYPVEGKTYYLYANQTGSTNRYYLYWDNTNSVLKHATANSKENDDYYKWTVTVSDGAYIITNVGTGTKLTWSSGLTLGASGLSFTLSQTVNYTACVSLYANLPGDGNRWCCVKYDTETFANGYKFSSFPSDQSQYGVNFVFEEVLPAHSLTDGSYYTIYCDNDSKQYLRTNGSSLTVTNTAPTAASSECIWKCIVSGDYYNFQNLATGQYLGWKAMQASAYNFTVATSAALHDGCATIWGVNASRYLNLSVSGTFDQGTGSFNKVTTDYSSDFRFDAITPTYGTPVTDLSTLSNSKAYVITNARGTWNFADNATAMNVATPRNLADDAQHIAIIQHESNYYLYSVNAGKYLTASNALTSNPTDNEQIDIVATGNASYPWFFRFKNLIDENDKYTKNINISASNIIIDGWGPNGSNSNGMLDDGNRNAIFLAGDYDLSAALDLFNTRSVNYTLQWSDGTQIGETVSNVTVTVSGDPADFLPTSFDNDFVTFSYSPATISSETTEVIVTATWNGPFQISSDFASAKWYTVASHKTYESNNYIWKYDGSSKVTTKTVATDDFASVTGNNLFAFMGNPYDGFTIYNYAAGSSLKLTRADDESTEATMGATATLFVPKASNAGTIANGYFCLQPKSGTNYINMHPVDTDAGTAKLEGWDVNDEGSTCWVIAPGQYYLDFIDALNLSAPVGAVGTNSYFPAQADPATAVSAISGLRSTVSSNMNSNELSSINSYLTPIKKYSTITLADGYYRIVNAYTGWASTAPTIYYNSTNNRMDWSVASNTSDNINSIVRIDASTPSIYSPNAGKYMSVINSTVSGALAAEAGTTVFTPLNSTQYNIIVGGGTMHSASHDNGAGTGSNLTSWGGTANTCSAWYIVKVESVPLTLNNGGDGYYYATMYMPFDVTISSGTTAYTLTVSGNYAIASEVEDNEVPAGTAVLLRGSSSSCTATINTGSAFNGGEPLDDNDLTGTYVDITGDRTTGEYIFGLVDDKVGFYVRKSSNKIGANKGYLLLGSDVSVKGFAIQWDFEDAIKDMDNTQQSNNNSGIYNLAGQRVKNAQKGIYIVNSKKVLVK